MDMYMYTVNKFEYFVYSTKDINPFNIPIFVTISNILSITTRIQTKLQLPKLRKSLFSFGKVAFFIF